jgi:predicted TIM-barrel fold metal-dependent hydrolase
MPADHFPSATGPYGFDQIHEICAAYPDIPVILLQLRFSTQAQLIPLMRRHANLHFTISWFGLFRQVESMVKMFGAERLLYGSGLPVGDPSMGIGMVSYGQFTPREKELIAGGNLSRLLGNVR